MNLPHIVISIPGSAVRCRSVDQTVPEIVVVLEHTTVTRVQRVGCIESGGERSNDVIGVEARAVVEDDALAQ